MKKLAILFSGLFLVFGLTTTLSAAEKCGTSKCGDANSSTPAGHKAEKCGAAKCGATK
ncbi:Uncharacterised protein [Campylobacter hyointestinalis subsp. hyointestinalis]|uniref:Periplasmic protein n=1 Tax=Campylobacter hyointestinalis subsp. hyointestinalis TaxID=91352 RepID=A0A9W5AT69_CAMHY|nr:hypothetical protein [Campylobacter hyointestinalis]CUU83134.1 Uncharacterised protein [Campylobacter hyointestinalis subsp. hyointestinalis]